MRAAERVAIAGAAGWLAVATAGAAGGGPVRVTIDAPGEVPIARAATAGAAGPRRLVLSVTGFAPSPAGPVEGVVTIRCGGAEREIGRFGLFPQTAFGPSDPGGAQAFGFALPDDPACREADRVTVRLAASAGDGRGASMELGPASVE
ncbi:hypothetical protein [Methylobacterium platani]|uniref:Spore coat protein U domain-containing protein n=1 Tax=Methylobacterium platani TaxID=427683 RepID=A0A179RZF9_9HYPH|nr:hypothetical protein [Methylobacterium platani]OAS17701.1 hypothetical protein A5481_27295 [Methylobacterium platani]